MFVMQTFSLLNERLGATILMVTHDAVVGSYASRVLFLKDGKIWNALYRGNRSRQAICWDNLYIGKSASGCQSDDA